MQARVVPALRGVQWLASGWRLFSAAPLGWLAVVFIYWVCMMVISLLPLGSAAAPLLVPAFSVGFMAAGRAAARGAPVGLAQLFEGFRSSPKPLLWLGVLYLACLAALVLLSGVSPGEFPKEVSGRLLAAGILYVPVMMAFWFAPVLAAWHGASPAKSLFFSFFACLVNWRAFLVYGSLTVLLPAIALLVLAQALGAATLRAIVMPLIILLLPTLLASFYASYRDVFATDSP